MGIMEKNVETTTYIIYGFGFRVILGLHGG